MENLPQKQTEQTGLQLSQTGKSPLAKINEAKQGLRLIDSTEDQIKDKLRDVFLMLGIPANKLPNDFEKRVLLDFIRDTYSEDLRLDEIKLAFSFAVSGAFEVDLNLYGEPFSCKYMANVVNGYKAYKLHENKKAFLNSKSQESGNGLTNMQRLSLIIPHLSDATKEKVSDIGKIKERSLERPKLPYEDLHQKWFTQFDKLERRGYFLKHRDYEGNLLPDRWIRRYGQIMNIDQYFNKKCEQLHLAKTRNKL